MNSKSFHTVVSTWPSMSVCCMLTHTLVLNLMNFSWSLNGVLFWQLRVCLAVSGWGEERHTVSLPSWTNRGLSLTWTL